ncbi:hypothetical protein HPB52_010631 [Rhipicephalus sanguineus]|uniref:Uncharacterized protein n=1 Tax=Rhipicephalus sanguineus TaxID=34632 RepID=A0A9D4SWG3_RHISA|nr:hypothetical protein HPB52_010631 [Rhipicephalus sanguineus]
MGKKDNDAYWYMCETKDSIRVLMVLYAFVTFLALVAEATSTVVTARNTDYHRRPYVWIMGATYTSLRFLTLIVIIYWIVAATRTNVRGMRMAFNIVFVRVIGNLIYNGAYFVTEVFLIASRVTSPVVLSPTTPRLPSRGDVSRVASPPAVTSPRKGAKARPSGSVAPSRVASPTVAYAPAK